MHLLLFLPDYLYGPYKSKERNAGAIGMPYNVNFEIAIEKFEQHFFHFINRAMHILKMNQSASKLVDAPVWYSLKSAPHFSGFRMKLRGGGGGKCNYFKGSINFS